MADEEQGLPMTQKWDPAKLAREVAELQALEAKPFVPRLAGYLKRSGPGLLQSAMTLGAGSAVASVVAGASFGYKLLWVQPVAMFLGIMMFAALGNVVLSTGERPYKSFSRELHVSIAFLWALATIVASVIWHFPQYALAAAAARDLATLGGLIVDAPATDGTRNLTTSGYAVSFGVAFTILAVNIFTTWNYGRGGRGIKIYEWFLRAVIALVILSFATVVIRTGIDWGKLTSGFFGFWIPSDANGITLVLGAIGATVGINMTFLYPYSLLAKGWGPHHKGLARCDLAVSMFTPFVLVTSLVIIAMANTVYAPAAVEAVRDRLQPVDAARSLTAVFQSESLGRVIFDLGFIGMTCGAISAQMVACGFTLCEMLGLRYSAWRYRLSTLLPCVGLLGAAFKTPMWLPIAASAVCLTLLPIAYIAFFAMNNKRSYLGDAVGYGWRRALFNAVLLVAIAVTTLGAAIKIKTGVVDKVFPATTPSASPATVAPR